MPILCWQVAENEEEDDVQLLVVVVPKLADLVVSSAVVIETLFYGYCVFLCFHHFWEQDEFLF